MKRINRLLALLGKHDAGTLRHCRSVAALMSDWANHVGFSERKAHKAYLCGLLHDIGKLHISCQILKKPERLTAGEWTIIKNHPAYGWEILSFAGLDEISHIIRYHHERYDGTGYGEGLAAVQIPLLSRMVAVCDAFDAMTGNRCYTKSMRSDQALQEIASCAGSQFDPGLCQQFVRFTEEGKRVRYAL